MTFKIEITEEAELEIARAKVWYEEEESPGLGDRCVKAIKERINSLKSPEVEHKVVFKNLRRVLVHPFPYVLYYKRDETLALVKIMAVLHNKQSQESLFKRVE